MHTRRRQLFTAAAVFAIAMVMGAWTTSTRAGGEHPPFYVVALLDGYENPPTKREGALCIAHAATYNQAEPMQSWDWDSSAHSNFNSNVRQIQDNLGYTSGYMYVTAVDDESQEDSDDIWVEVSSTGEFCEG